MDYTEGAETSAKDGSTWGFCLSAYCYAPLQVPMAYVNHHISLDARESYPC
jgi:hypothetical protein